jgi:hypothetical protein
MPHALYNVHTLSENFSMASGIILEKNVCNQCVLPAEQTLLKKTEIIAH